MVENGEIRGTNPSDDKKNSSFSNKEKLPDGISGLSFTQTSTPHFVYDNAVYQQDNGFGPYFGDSDSEIPPKYDDLNM